MLIAPEAGHKYGNAGGSISFLMWEARDCIEEGNLCAILTHKVTRGFKSGQMYSWVWPADYLPNPESVEKVGEFVT